ncbi:MAG: lysophospholipid acyltransferase family protein [Planctomycetes bacterium]|nr:lysophospholipid acyltransferase family protein [Planctomycetota bacterium]
MTGHFGNWELAGCALTGVYPINGISRRFRNPLIRRSILRLRRAFGEKVIFAGDGLEPMLACLRRNECIALLPDKRLRAARITVDFFGRRVCVPSSPALLSWRTGAPLLTGGALRIGETPRFQLVHGEPIRPDPTAPKGTEIRRLSQAWTTALEQLIRQHPEQWIWTHNRFKHAPATARPQPKSASTQTVDAPLSLKAAPRVQPS